MNMILPRDRPPTHPGELLLEEFLRPLGMTQMELAERIRVSYPRVNEIVNKRRGITPDTALRLARLFGTTPEFWLNGQLNSDLWQAFHSRTAEEIEEIEPLGVRLMGVRRADKLHRGIGIDEDQSDSPR